ncbi:MAG: hypothetical protein GF403_01235 [Candidatus Coatesbacteria bacterium]|nr:hypothetical protein [Candidatus Coatesbacteria bacterium]
MRNSRQTTDRQLKGYYRLYITRMLMKHRNNSAGVAWPTAELDSRRTKRGRRAERCCR